MAQWHDAFDGQKSARKGLQDFFGFLDLVVIISKGNH